MNVIDKVKDFFYDNSEDDANYDDSQLYNEDADNSFNTRPFERTQAPADEPANSNVNITTGSSIEMKVIRPEKLDNSVTQIADYLINKNTVLLNLESTNKETARRLLDFLNGVAYAVGGKLKKVANSTFVITPSNVSISGENIADTTSDHEAI